MRSYVLCVALSILTASAACRSSSEPHSKPAPVVLAPPPSQVSATAAITSAPPPATTSGAPTALPPKYTLTDSIKAGIYDSSLPVVVVVDKKSHTTYALQLQDKEVVSVLSIGNAVGKRATPTPTGRTTVVDKKLDPVWTPPKSIDPKQKKVAPYSKTHKNPLGVAALRTGMEGILLHGTNAPRSIGTNASHGCVRHQNTDILKLFDMVKVGDAVYLVRDIKGTVVKTSDFQVR